MWVVYVIIVMFIAMLVKCCYDSVYGKDNLEGCNQKEEHLSYESLDEFGLPKKKPRISPPVHSMLELMMKDPDNFIEKWDGIVDAEKFEHLKSSTTLGIYVSWGSDEKDYYINTCRITKGEGEYLQQGVEYIRACQNKKMEKLNKERRHKVDREIRKVLEENNL